MKKVAVVGLGIIGGSICASLSRAGYSVDGTDLNEESVLFALEKGYIANKATALCDYDVVFLAIPPRSAIALLQTEPFKEGALVADICGVKEELEKAVYEEERAYLYVGLHPMAGKETSGITSASPELFRMANLIIVRADQTKESAIAEIKEYALAMRFGKIVECTAEEHDKKIALTSQLAHLVSNAYVKSAHIKACDGFTGGSFQDMTRIAGVDEKMWSQLYMLNREAILEELDGLISHLSEYRKAITEGNEDELSNALKEGRLIREQIRFRKN